MTLRPGFFTLASRADVVRRALKVALVVGTILVVINHGQALLHGDLGPSRLLRIALTVAVPYCVATWSSVAAIRAAPSEGSPRG